MEAKRQGEEEERRRGASCLASGVVYSRHKLLASIRADSLRLTPVPNTAALFQHALSDLAGASSSLPHPLLHSLVRLGLRRSEFLAANVEDKAVKIEAAEVGVCFDCLCARLAAYLIALL